MNPQVCSFMGKCIHQNLEVQLLLCLLGGKWPGEDYSTWDRNKRTALRERCSREHKNCHHFRENNVGNREMMIKDVK